MRISLVFVVFAAITGSTACSSTTTGTSGTSGTGTSGTSGSAAVSASNCSSRCQLKATQCGEPAADAMTSCSSLCSSTTEGQLSCLEAAACSKLTPTNFDTVCPKDTGSSGTTSGGTSGGTSGTSGSSGGTAVLGDACTCASATPGSEGYCAGTTQPCMSNLKCIYNASSNGAGHCYAASCCDSTTACDNDTSLLKSCSTGMCQRTAVGYYCGL